MSHNTNKYFSAFKLFDRTVRLCTYYGFVQYHFLIKYIGFIMHKELLEIWGGGEVVMIHFMYWINPQGMMEDINVGWDIWSTDKFHTRYLISASTTPNILHNNDLYNTCN
jgi:hypothetical protein